MTVHTFIQNEREVSTARQLLRKLNRKGLCRHECDKLVQLQREITNVERDLLLGYANTLMNRRNKPRKK